MERELANQRNKLKPCSTKVTSIDGKVETIENGVVVDTNTKNEGYVVDTKPDSIPSLIEEYLYLGSQDCVADLDKLKQWNIKHILCVAPMIESLYPTVCHSLTNFSIE